MAGGDPLSAVVCGGGCSGSDGEGFGRRRLSRETQRRNWAYDISMPSRLAACQTSLSFMPAAKPASISAQAQVTWPTLVAGWVEGRERKWIKSDLVFLRRVFGVVSIDVTCICSLT